MGVFAAISASAPTPATAQDIIAPAILPPILEPNPRAAIPDDPDDGGTTRNVPTLIVPNASSSFAPLQSLAPLQSQPRPPRIGVFSLLHKVSGRVSQVRLALDKASAVEHLHITMRDCIAAPPEEPPETRVFLEINEGDKRLFSGWMFARSPALNALEHPVYDIWVLACQTPDGEPYTG